MLPKPHKIGSRNYYPKVIDVQSYYFWVRNTVLKKTSQEKITGYFRRMGTCYTIGYCMCQSKSQEKITRKNHKITNFILSNGEPLK